MVKCEGNEIFRGGEKIGWMEENHIYDRTGKRVGYFEENFIYNEDGQKVAFIEEDFLMPYGAPTAGVAKIRLEQIAEDVTGGVIPGIARGAIYVLLGS